MTPGIEQGAGQTEPPRARPSIISATHNINNNNGAIVRSAPLVGGVGSSGAGMDTVQDGEGSSRPQPLAAPSASGSAASKKRNEPTSADHDDHAASPAAEQSSSPKRPRAASRPQKVLPERYEHCPVSDMVVLIANMIGELIETNDPLQRAGGQLTRFHSRTAPGISVVEYLKRLAKHATVPTPLLLVVVYYIDRLCAVYKEFTINTLTVHRFLITAVTVASKGLSDAFWNNTTYARVGGLKVAELRLLELEFLYRMDWKIIPIPESLEQYYRGLVQRTPGYCFQGDEAQMDGPQLQQQQEIGDESSGEGKDVEPTQAQSQASGPQDDDDGVSDEDEDEDDEMDDESGEGESPATGTTSPSRT